jgi:hypothetical protein
MLPGQARDRIREPGERDPDLAPGAHHARPVSMTANARIQ